MTNSEFWAHLDQLIAQHHVIIDRPRGSRHPSYADLRYPFDYGHLSGTNSGDGHEIDVWIGGLPDQEVTGLVCTVDLLKADAEIKLLIGCAISEAKVILKLHRSGDQSAILVMRHSSVGKPKSRRNSGSGGSRH